MHVRNPYRIPPDFTQLSESYPKLKQHLIHDPKTGKPTIDFKDETAQRRLTEAIMQRDFGVTLDIPSTRLCPPVPNRLNYALWIQDIVRAHEDVLGSHSRARPIRGIDIGTGSTAIYPILICKLEATWEMVATEIDYESYESARRNISNNNMQSRIHVEKASPDQSILFPLEDDRTFEFTMCNPPFYGSAAEVVQSAEAKEFPPNAVCTGADIEMIYPHGGEEGFVMKILDESERFMTRCKWYTSMLGKMSSVATIVEVLRQRSITNYAVTEFVQGQTRRWAIAWSFADTRLPDTMARIQSISPKHALYPCMPPKNTLVQAFPGPATHLVSTKLIETLHGIEGVSYTTTSLNSFFVEARQNTWSRSARRSRANKNSSKKPDPASLDADDILSGSQPALTCSCRVLADTAHADPVNVVENQWIFGNDRALFESFVGHVSRKVGMGLRGVK
uniref:U6 small nuclear RNA (adenine-(43)-N(6))-methyltransferase n=1 Tax=Psilocybe cubensis TaxID=181762 RepID=A0A8H7XML2_PSICU